MVTKAFELVQPEACLYPPVLPTMHWVCWLSFLGFLGLRVWSSHFGDIWLLNMVWTAVCWWPRSTAISFSVFPGFVVQQFLLVGPHFSLSFFPFQQQGISDYAALHVIDSRSAMCNGIYGFLRMPGPISLASTFDIKGHQYVLVGFAVAWILNTPQTTSDSMFLFYVCLIPCLHYALGTVLSNPEWFWMHCEWYHSRPSVPRTERFWELVRLFWNWSAWVMWTEEENVMWPVQVSLTSVTWMKKKPRRCGFFSKVASLQPWPLQCMYHKIS